MAVRNLTQIPIYIFIPPIYSPVYKVEIVGTSTTDVTDIIYDGEYTDGVTETIGTFRFRIDNANETYTNTFKLFDKIRIYLDYSTTATTLRFEGIIERISKTDSTIVLTGRSTAAKTLGTLVTYSASATETSAVLGALITKYFSGIITTTNVNVSTTNVTVNWYQKNFWECVQELCSAAGFDAYIDNVYDMHYFESGTVSNAVEMVVHDANLFETGDFSPDLTFVKNRIVVYGQEIDSLPIIATANDTASQASYGLKEETITDTNISTITQAQDRADYELSVKKDPPNIGELTSLGLPTLQPGEKLKISDPYNGLDPNEYQIQKFTHKFSNDYPFSTVVTVLKERSTIPKILKKRLSFEQEISSNINPNEMKYSQIYDFNTATGGFTDCEAIAGFLKCTVGESTGTWISPSITASSIATYAEVRVKGNQITENTYWVSSDNGINYASVSPDTKITLTPPGTALRLKIILNSATAEVDTVGLLYS